MTNEEVVTEAEVDEILEKTPDAKMAKPEDLAAAFFSKHEQDFLSAMKQLSLRQLRRVCTNLVMGTFAPKAYNPQDQKERRAAYIGNEMIWQRTIMQLSHEALKVEEAQKAKMDEDLKKIDELTNSELSEDAKELLKQNNVEV